MIYVFILTFKTPIESLKKPKLAIDCKIIFVYKL